MPILSILKSYQDGNVLFAQDLDNIVNSIETFLNVTKLDADNIQNGAIGTQQLAVGAITTDKIAPGAVVTSAIADGAVTTAKISDGAITTAKISDGAVTRAKLEPLGEQISASSGDVLITSTSFVDVPNLTISINPQGRPIQFFLAAATPSLAALSTSNGTSEIRVLRDADEVYRVVLDTGANNTTAQVPCSTVFGIDPAGVSTTVTYKVQGRRVDGSLLAFTALSLVCYRL